MSAPSRAAVLLLAALLAGCSTPSGPAGGPPPSPIPSTTGAPATSAPPSTDVPPSATVPPSPAVPSPSAPAATGRAPVVVLDPGHNGGNASHPAAANAQVPDGRGGTKACNTTGTQTDAGYPEHAFAWDLAQRVRAQLVAHGITVVLTRSDDTGVGPCVDARGAAAAKAGADAMVSLHGDGSAPGNRGFHVAYSDPPLGPAQAGPAHVLAADLRDALREGGFPVSNYIGRDGLSARSDLAGLNLATRPAALVECANMRNAAEAALVSTPEGRERYATAVAAGIARFVGR